MKHFSEHLADGRTYLKNKSSDKLEKVEQMANVQKNPQLNQ
jgi:hypothetical protein